MFLENKILKKMWPPFAQFVASQFPDKGLHLGL